MRGTIQLEGQRVKVRCIRSSNVTRSMTVALTEPGPGRWKLGDVAVVKNTEFTPDKHTPVRTKVEETLAGHRYFGNSEQEWMEWAAGMAQKIIAVLEIKDPT